MNKTRLLTLISVMCWLHVAAAFLCILCGMPVLVGFLAVACFGMCCLRYLVATHL